VNNAWIPQKLFVYWGISKKDAHYVVNGDGLCGNERDGGADYDGGHYYTSTLAVPYTYNYIFLLYINSYLRST